MKSIFSVAVKATDPAKVAQAAARNARIEIEPSSGRDAQLERHPNRQIAEQEAVLETVTQAEPGTVREAAPTKASPHPAPKSPAPVADDHRANEPVEMDMDHEMHM